MRSLSGYLARSAVFWWEWVLNPPVVWVDVADGSEESERWTRRRRLTLRPRFWGLLRREPCGCSRRLGRRVLFAMDCETHSPETAGWLNGEAFR